MFSRRSANCFSLRPVGISIVGPLFGTANFAVARTFSRGRSLHVASSASSCAFAIARTLGRSSLGTKSAASDTTCEKRAMSSSM